MNETLKQDRLLRQQGNNSSYPHSPAGKNSGKDLQKSVRVFVLLVYQLPMILILGCTFLSCANWDALIMDMLFWFFVVVPIAVIGCHFPASYMLNCTFLLVWNAPHTVSKN